MTRPLTAAQVAAFHQDGFVLVPHMFDAEEITALRDTARRDNEMQDASLPVKDAAGRISKLSLWNEAGEDIYGRFARCSRVVDAAEQLLDDEVYHYHSKLSLKEPFVGGAWEWHQDYGYWYGNGCLFPRMLSALTAIDPCDRENGCVQVLRGSHLMGRIDHGVSGTQTGADDERTRVARERLELVHVEQDPGDTLFFHCNLLHSSAPNESSRPRWTLITAYNARSNDPYKPSQHPGYTPLDKVADADLLIGTEFASDREFMRQ